MTKLLSIDEGTSKQGRPCFCCLPDQQNGATCIDAEAMGCISANTVSVQRVYESPSYKRNCTIAKQIKANTYKEPPARPAIVASWVALHSAHI